MPVDFYGSSQRRREHFTWRRKHFVPSVVGLHTASHLDTKWSLTASASVKVAVQYIWALSSWPVTQITSWYTVILLGLAVCILPSGVEKPSTLPSFYRFILSSENLSWSRFYQLKYHPQGYISTSDFPSRKGITENSGTYESTQFLTSWWYTLMAFTTIKYHLINIKALVPICIYHEVVYLKKN